ncbi:MAG: dihydrolipoamide acetyltransferase family protein [Gemmatimonadaceae bacterium]|nr:dihydrolipoamide acetyltransferase family protein [Gemmatimonadaceae bacterium]
MPQMGESIAEGTLSRWLKKPGDAVKRDEAIFEISTDKVDAEIPSPSAGILVEILVTEGMTVPVQAVVARLETEAGAAVVVSEPAAPPTAAEPVAVATVVPGAGRRTGRCGTAPRADSLEERLRTRSSPLVRKIAAEHGVEITGINGSGVAGRVTKRDILAHIETAPAAGPASAPAPSAPNVGLPVSVAVPAAASIGAHDTPTAQVWPGDVVEPFSKIRRLTSDHMTQARRLAAHVTSFFEVDLTRVARIRAAMRKDFEAQNGQKLTFLPFIVQAVIGQLKRHPMMNAAVNGTDMIYRKQYNIGIAVALDPTGLIVPVVKRADDLSLGGLTKAINDLAARARSKGLKPDEVTQATFTITNPGVFGSLMGTPIIPVGTTAILGLGAIEKRPKVITGPDGEDTIAIRTCAYFSISFDHKVVDGADADRAIGSPETPKLEDPLEGHPLPEPRSVSRSERRTTPARAATEMPRRPPGAPSTEAPTRETLQAALAEAPEQVLDANRIYQEIPLS